MAVNVIIYYKRDERKTDPIGRFGFKMGDEFLPQHAVVVGFFTTPNCGGEILESTLNPPIEKMSDLQKVDYYVQLMRARAHVLEASTKIHKMNRTWAQLRFQASERVSIEAYFNQHWDDSEFRDLPDITDLLAEFEEPFFEEFLVTDGNDEAIEIFTSFTELLPS